MNLDYVAGLFDGEGWFSINKGKRKDTSTGYGYQVHAALSVKQYNIIKLLQEEFGGSISILPETNRHATYYTWSITGVNVQKFATKLVSRLIIKHKQAKLALVFQDHKSENKNRPNSKERWEEQESMYLQMKHLNRRGPIKGVEKGL